MLIKTFTYNSNQIQYLCTGLFLLGLSAMWLYHLGIPNFYVFDTKLVAQLFLFLLQLIFIWLGLSSLNRYRKLHGKIRTLTLSEKSIKFPEFGNSLNVIELNYDQIEEIYYSVTRHNIPHDLIIKYGNESHAYIGKSELTIRDFEEICDLLKQYLGLENIETKKA